MLNQSRHRLVRGFTLIELLIVVIILAILAAIVIPQFGNTSVDAKEATLDANLSAMRSAIELYKIQHNGVYPGAAASTATAGCTGGTLGAGAAGSQAFIDQLTNASDGTGKTCTIADATTYRYGPYVRGRIPNEPINNKGSLPAEIVATTTGAAIAPSAATGGWAIDTKSGQIVMNSNAVDSKNLAYSTH